MPKTSQGLGLHHAAQLLLRAAEQLRGRHLQPPEAELVEDRVRHRHGRRQPTLRLVAEQPADQIHQLVRDLLLEDLAQARRPQTGQPSLLVVRVHGQQLLATGDAEDLHDLDQLSMVVVSSEHRVPQQHLGHHAACAPQVDLAGVVGAA